MPNLNKYMQQIEMAFPAAAASDIYSIGHSTLDKVSRFLTERNAIREGAFPEISIANESLSFDDAMNASGTEELINLIKSCGVNDAYVKPCCESVLSIMDRCLHRSAAAAWNEQNKKHSTVSNSAPASASLSDIYASDTVSILTGNVAPSQEAFGVNVDLAMPDLKIAITVAIMNFHTRLLPRLLPTKSINQPEIQYSKEYLEVYDLGDTTQVDTPRRRLLDLYSDPSFAANELKRIVPLLANDGANENPARDPEFLEADGWLKFGVKANILRLSIKNDYGYNRINRTDLVAENVKLEAVRFAVGSQTVEITVPLALNRLTRTINSDDTAIRNADIKFRAVYHVGDKATDGEAIAAINGLGADEMFVVDFNLKPTISLKYGDVDCLGAIRYAVVKDKNSAAFNPDNLELSTGAKAILEDLKDDKVALVSYSLDARFSEENLRKTNIAVWTHRQPFSYDIPIGRNYVFDYAIGQENADENAVNLTKVIGLGQDHIALHDVCKRTIEDVGDRIAAVGPNPEDRADYVGTRYVAGDKVRPTVYRGTLDFTTLNVIRDADRPGDIKQKALTFLNAVTSNVLYDSMMLQQLDGAGVTFRCVTSMTVLGKVMAQPHIHSHMDKEDARDLGDGIEYVLVLPNGVRIEIVTTTFNYMKDTLMMWPIIKNNAESELNFAMN